MTRSTAIRRLLPLVLGKHCPVCGGRTDRERTYAFGYVTLRRCRRFHWNGLALHSARKGPVRPAAAPIATPLAPLQDLDPSELELPREEGAPLAGHDRGLMSNRPAD